jgi:hypothetical protein
MGEMSNTAAAAAPRSPTEDAPCVGEIRHAEYSEIVLCRIEEWHEDGLYVVRSLDFDLITMHEDRRKAIHQFVSEVYDLCFQLAKLMQAEAGATEGERETFFKLARPILAVEERDRRERLRKRILSHLRRRGHGGREWRLGSVRAKPAEHSLA